MVDRPSHGDKERRCPMKSKLFYLPLLLLVSACAPSGYYDEYGYYHPYTSGTHSQSPSTANAARPDAYHAEALPSDSYRDDAYRSDAYHDEAVRADAYRTDIYRPDHPDRP